MELTDQKNYAVEEDEGRSQVVLVSEVRKGIHDNRGENVWWCNETLRSGNTETHAVVQDDGEEIGDSVGVGRGESKECGETPDLQVCCVLQVLANVEFLWDGIVTVLFDPGDDEGSLFLGQEFELETLSCGLFGEICDEEEGTETKQTSQKTLHDAMDVSFWRRH